MLKQLLRCKVGYIYSKNNFRNLHKGNNIYTQFTERKLENKATAI